MKHRIARLGLGVAITLLSVTSVSYADVLLAWDFYAAGPPASTTGNVTSPVAATTTHVGIQTETVFVSPSMLTRPVTFNADRGAMVAAVMWSGAGWSGSSLAAAISNDAYIQWSIAPTGGYTMSLDSLDLVTTQLGTSTTSKLEVLYSLDGFATAGTSVGVCNPIGASWTGSNANLALSGFSNLQNTTSTVTFRAYGYQYTDYERAGLGEIPGYNTDLGLNGTVVPEPGTLALLAFGSLAIMKFRRKKNS